jgi:hypothetical protein
MSSDSKKKRIVAFFGPLKDMTTAELNSRCHEKIDNVITDPHVHIILPESFVFAIKYLERRKYPRSRCTVYHLGEKPQKTHSFRNKGGFTSGVELNACLEQDASEEILFL